jgi:hypothetical protein
MKTYDLVLRILTRNPATRNSDNLLFAEVLRALGAIKPVQWFSVEKEAVLLDSILSGNLPSFETIRRTRQKLQETKPELGATSSKVKALRRQKQSSKGTFIYREVVEAMV